MRRGKLAGGQAVRYPLVVRRGSVEQDAMVRIEVAFNDPVRAAVELTTAYEEAWSKIMATVGPPTAEGKA